MALAQLQEFELKTDGGNCPDNLEREIESLKKSKAHYAKLKFEIYDDYTKTNITLSAAWYIPHRRYNAVCS